MLSNQQKEILKSLNAHLFDMFKNETTGHDYYHIKRVVDLTARLMPYDDPDYFLALLIAYCHDIFDDKINPTEDLETELRNLLLSWNIELGNLEIKLISGIKEIGYIGGFGLRNKSHAASYVSDADLLDAMGAVGIARTFYYAGSRQQHFHNPNLSFSMPDSIEAYRELNRNPIDHFNEKLLLLKDWIVTDKGKQEAEKRHQILVDFYNQFMDEVNINKEEPIF